MDVKRRRWEEARPEELLAFESEIREEIAARKKEAKQYYKDWVRREYPGASFFLRTFSPKRLIGALVYGLIGLFLLGFIVPESYYASLEFAALAGSMFILAAFFAALFERGMKKRFRAHVNWWKLFI